MILKDILFSKDLYTPLNGRSWKRRDEVWNMLDHKVKGLSDGGWLIWYSTLVWKTPKNLKSRS